MEQTVLKQMFDTSCFNGDSPNVFFVRSVILNTRLPIADFLSGKKVENGFKCD